MSKCNHRKGAKALTDKAEALGYRVDIRSYDTCEGRHFDISIHHDAVREYEELDREYRYCCISEIKHKFLPRFIENHERYVQEKIEYLDKLEAFEENWLKGLAGEVAFVKEQVRKMSDSELPFYYGGHGTRVDEYGVSRHFGEYLVKCELEQDPYKPYYSLEAQGKRKETTVKITVGRFFKKEVYLDELADELRNLQEYIIKRHRRKSGEKN